MKCSFIVKDSKRLKQLQQFMGNNMPTARFVGEPLELFKGDYMIKLDFNSSDASELNTLTNKWHEEDELDTK